MQPDGLTVVVPVYNEVESLEQFTLEMNKFLDQSPVPTRVLFVNDGSSDGSQDLLERICAEGEAYHYLQLDENHGLSTAIKAGIDAVDTELVGYIDSDIQTSPEDFLKYFEYLPEYDMVNGIRTGRKDSFVKRASSVIANSIRRALINDHIEDTCCPLKIIKTTYAKQIPFFKGMHRFMPALIQLQGGKVKQVPVRHFPRFAGAAKYNLFNRLIGPLVDTFAYRWMRSRYIRYELRKSS